MKKIILIWSILTAAILAQSLPPTAPAPLKRNANHILIVRNTADTAIALQSIIITKGGADTTWIDSLGIHSNSSTGYTAIQDDSLYLGDAADSDAVVLAFIGNTGDTAWQKYDPKDSGGADGHFYYKVGSGAWTVFGSGTGGGSSWNWSDSSSHGADSVLFADSSNHADSATGAARAAAWTGADAGLMTETEYKDSLIADTGLYVASWNRLKDSIAAARADIRDTGNAIGYLTVVDSTKITNLSVAYNDLDTGGFKSWVGNWFTGAYVTNQSLDSMDLAPNSVTGSEIAASAVDQSELATGSVISAKILDSAINSIDMSTPLLDSIKNGVTAYGWGNHASAGYLTAETGDISAVTAGNGLEGGGTTGGLTLGVRPSTTIDTIGDTVFVKDGSISSTKILDGAITKIDIDTTAYMHFGTELRIGQGAGIKSIKYYNTQDVYQTLSCNPTVGAWTLTIPHIAGTIAVNEVLDTITTITFPKADSAGKALKDASGNILTTYYEPASDSTKQLRSNRPDTTAFPILGKTIVALKFANGLFADSSSDSLLTNRKQVGNFIDTTTLDTIQNAHKAQNVAYADSAGRVIAIGGLTVTGDLKVTGQVLPVGQIWKLDTASVWAMNADDSIPPASLWAGYRFRDFNGYYDTCHSIVHVGVETWPYGFGLDSADTARGWQENCANQESYIASASDSTYKWEHIMVFTPLAGDCPTGDTVENPTIRVSHDGYNWLRPYYRTTGGVTRYVRDPIVTYDNVPAADYLSDATIFITKDNLACCGFRATDGAVHKLMGITSKDPITWDIVDTFSITEWSSSVKISPWFAYSSVEDRYFCWYTATVNAIIDTTVLMRISTKPGQRLDTVWTGDTITCTLPRLYPWPAADSQVIWHNDGKRFGNQFVMIGNPTVTSGGIVTAAVKDHLFMMVSDNGITWNLVKGMYDPWFMKVQYGNWDTGGFYRSTFSYVNNGHDGYFNLWYPGYGNFGYRIGYTQIRLSPPIVVPLDIVYGKSKIMAATDSITATLPIYADTLTTYLINDSANDASGITDTLMFGATIRETGYYDSLEIVFFADDASHYITNSRIYGPDRSNGFGIADSIYYEDATDITANNVTVKNQRYIGEKFKSGDEIIVRLILTFAAANDVIKIDKVYLWGRRW